MSAGGHQSVSHHRYPVDAVCACEWVGVCVFVSGWVGVTLTFSTGSMSQSVFINKVNNSLL